MNNKCTQEGQIISVHPGEGDCQFCFQLWENTLFGLMVAGCSLGSVAPVLTLSTHHTCWVLVLQCIQWSGKCCWALLSPGNDAEVPFPACSTWMSISGGIWAAVSAHMFLQVLCTSPHTSVSYTWQKHAAFQQWHSHHRHNSLVKDVLRCRACYRGRWCQHGPSSIPQFLSIRPAVSTAGCSPQEKCGEQWGEVSPVPAPARWPSRFWFHSKRPVSAPLELGEFTRDATRSVPSFREHAVWSPECCLWRTPPHTPPFLGGPPVFLGL